jgi:hypothetical protein
MGLDNLEHGETLLSTYLPNRLVHELQAIGQENSEGIVRIQSNCYIRTPLRMMLRHTVGISECKLNTYCDSMRKTLRRMELTTNVV